MKCCCKGPYVFPGIMSMCEANTIYIIVINCEMTIFIIGPICIWWSLLVTDTLATAMCISYTMKVEGCRGAAMSTNVHCTESLWSGEQFQSFRTCVASVGHVDFGHTQPASCYPFTGPVHVTVHVERRVHDLYLWASSGRREQWGCSFILPAGRSRVTGDASRKWSWVMMGKTSCSNELKMLLFTAVVMCASMVATET